MRAILACFPLLIGLVLGAAPVHLQVDAPFQPRQQVTLYVYMDAFTRRLEPIARGHTDALGQAVLEAEVTGTRKALLRVGDTGADLWLRPGTYHVQMPAATGEVNAISGMANVDPTFIDLDALDINALVSDLNGRLDAFVAEGLATDAQAGMEAVAKARGGGTALQPDSTGAGRDMYLSPTWSAARVDTFAAKLRKFYAAVQDPWFQQDLEYGIAGLYLGPNANNRELYQRFLLGRPVLYEVPEYTRFFNNFHKDHLLRFPFRSHPEALLRDLRLGRTDSLKALLAQNDLLKDERLNELVLITNLYANHGNALLDADGIRTVLKDVEARSLFPEHRRIAANMLWDLSAMAPGTTPPRTDLIDPAGRAIALDSLLHGDVCVLVVKPGNTYSEQELAAITLLHKEYGRYCRLVCIALGPRPETPGTGSQANKPGPGTWAMPADQRAFLDAWRIRSAPTLFLLRDGLLKASPGPLPSMGLGAELHKLKVEQDARQRITPDRGPPPKR
ncbi:MAG: hypothetical protein KBH07_08515 [Flavobacteriales bacterium]|nr:hypothetical protein [Flavobacteriales bacterium]MBP9078619.1 hypothetical protein [Flavobacteriales bacterium]